MRLKILSGYHADLYFETPILPKIGDVFRLPIYSNAPVFDIFDSEEALRNETVEVAFYKVERFSFSGGNEPIYFLISNSDDIYDIMKRFLT